MACQWYPKGKQNFVKDDATPNFNLSTGGGNVIKALLVKSGAAFDVNDEFVADVIAGSVEMSGGSYARQALGSKTITQSGSYSIFSSAAVTFSALPVGSTAVAMILYADIGGSDADNPVIAWFDGGSYPNDLPKACTGGDLVCSPHATDGWLKF